MARTAICSVQTFNTASNVDITAYTGVGGLTFASPQGSGKLGVDTSGKIYGIGGFLGYNYISVAPAGADQAAVLDITRQTGPNAVRMIIMLRYDTATGYYVAAEYDNNNEYFRIYEVVASGTAEIQRQSVSITTGTPYTMDFEVTGTTATLLVNGAASCSGTITHTATGRHAIGIINSEVTAVDATHGLTGDNYQAFDVTTVVSTWRTPHYSQYFPAAGRSRRTLSSYRAGGMTVFSSSYTSLTTPFEPPSVGGGGTIPWFLRQHKR